MSTLDSEQLLKMMDVDVWVPRAKNKKGQKNTSTQHSEWEKLRKEVAECKRCPLFKTRTQTVFGVGNVNAELMFIGEAPGAQEDKQGEPFVGRAGQLLDSMLHAVGFSRQDIYIANILKSRPPNNRDPLPEEVATCTPFLIRQIALIQPKLLVTLGRIAAQFLLNTTVSIGNLRGKQFYYGVDNIPTLAMYHPAYLLRSPQNKSKAYEDLCLIKQTLEKLRDGSIKTDLP
jgi:uracil-DNA glycosylase